MYLHKSPRTNAVTDMHSDRNLLLFQNWMHDCGVTIPILLPMPPDHGISDMVQPVLSCTAETGGIQFKIYFLKHLWKYSKPIPYVYNILSWKVNYAIIKACISVQIDCIMFHISLSLTLPHTSQIISLLIPWRYLSNIPSTWGMKIHR